MLKFNNWKINNKIMVIVIIPIMIGAVGSFITYSQMTSLGFEIQGVAERDIPLVNALTEVEINQLEQAINFEQILRLSGLGSEHGGNSHLKAAEANFEKYSKLAQEEISTVLEMVKKNLKADHLSDPEKEKLQSVLVQIELIATQHEEYDHTVQKAIEAINNGATDGELSGLLQTIEAEQVLLIDEVTKLLKEVEAFTENALIAAEHHEAAAAQNMVIFSILTAVIGFSIGFFVSRLISTPIKAMTSAMNTLSGGHYNIDIPAQGREDEVGEMATSVQVFKENLIKNKELSDSVAEEQKERVRRAELRDQITASFDKDISSMLESVDKSTNTMEETAQNMSAIAEQTTAQSVTVASASEEASVNVQTVSAASEELAASIVEISRQVSQSTDIAGSAVVEVENTNEKIQGLAEAANKIGEVVALITDIADQTNLLALNATIEAARAGDAGKGFAVVASEVKNLANQTAKATEQISSQISDIQNATQAAVTAIGSIGGTIGQINEITSGIAAAVEEQGAATQEIARNVEQAAQGTSDVSQNIEGVRQAAGETAGASNKVLQVVHELKDESATLSSQVEKFFTDIKQA